ncbi:MATE family efflux transporter [Vibrio nomapromontoriensis]|uniref:MATE family efflux transporter n=1 Tax=Vibrio nomapromontoriensis TaxID=2910246 RepID=UPI003D0A955F
MIAMWRTADSNFWRKVCSIAIPVATQSILYSLLSLVDALMVAPLGDSAVASVGLGGRIVFFNLLAIYGSCAGVTVLAAQYFGANDILGVKRSLGQSIIMSTIVSLPFALLYTIAPSWVIGLASNDVEFNQMATDYLLFTGWTILLTAIVVPLESMFRAVGEATVPTYISIFASLLNVGLNALLIFGLYGFPEMGVVGAAIGTAISRVVQMLILGWYLYSRRRQYCPNKHDVKSGLTLKARQLYLKIAFPALLQNGGWAAGILTYSILMGHISVGALAVVSMLSPVEAVILSLFYGISVAASTLIGQELGAERYQRAWYVAWRLIIVAVILAFFIGPLTYLLRDDIQQVLNYMNTPQLDVAIQILLIMAFAVPLRALNMLGLSGALRSGGDMKYALFIELFGLWGIGIPVAVFTIFVLGWPLNWVMVAILLEEAVKGCLVLHRIFAKRWLTNLVNEPA